MFNPNDIYTAVLAVIGSAPVTAYLIKKLGKPVEQKIEQVVKNDAPVVKRVITDVVDEAEKLLQLPELATIKAELSSKEKSMKESELGRIAGAALHSWETNFASLTQNQKGTLVTLVRTEIAKKFPDVTDAEIVSALNAVQALSDGFKETQAYKATVALEESLKALTQVQPSA
jgi:hypothetical protein